MRLLYSLFFLILMTNIVFCESLKGLDGYQQYTIDASKNARLHNNMGNIYFDEKNYNAALGEYELAYKLTKNSNSNAPYIYNMARCMIRLGNYKQAQYLVEEAIKKDCINVIYYETLVDCYIVQNSYKKELERCLKDTKNPYSRIIAGLIYLKTGQKIDAKIIFDEFINDNPDMIISDDVRLIIREINKK